MTEHLGNATPPQPDGHERLGPPFFVPWPLAVRWVMDPDFWEDLEPSAPPTMTVWDYYQAKVKGTPIRVAPASFRAEDEAQDRLFDYICRKTERSEFEPAEIRQAMGRLAEARGGPARASAIFDMLMVDFITELLALDAAAQRQAADPTPAVATDRQAEVMPAAASRTDAQTPPAPPLADGWPTHDAKLFRLLDDRLPKRPADDDCPWVSHEAWSEATSQKKRILLFMYGKESATVEDFAQHVWGHGEVSAETIRTAINRANEVLPKLGSNSILISVRGESRISWS